MNASFRSNYTTGVAEAHDPIQQRRRGGFDSVERQRDGSGVVRVLLGVLLRPARAEVQREILYEVPYQFD